MRRFDIPSFAALALAIVGCRPAAPAETPAPAEAAPPAAPAAEASAATPPAKCSGEMVAAADGLVDDFEDGNGQVSVASGRDGYWWIASDGKGTKVTAPGTSFAPADGGAGSAKAAHIAGKTGSSSDDWGAEFGANLINAPGSLYDGSKYAGIKFKAKAVGPTQKVRVSLGDVNTHQDAKVCKACWNHFNKNVTLTPEWAEYSVSFAELAQRPGWGDPRPPSVDPKQLVSISFAVDGGQEFDVWVDDVQFVACKE
jgi:hypothetical protein